MKYKFFLCFVSAAVMFAACDDTTENIGTSLSHDMDQFDITTESFNVASRSILADSIYLCSTTGHLGKIKDPETDAYITGSFMTQFYAMEDYQKLFPPADKIVSIYDERIVADSCELRLFYTSLYGDTLATMKLVAHEMGKPMYENRIYYSNFDPKKEGYVRADGIHESKTYTLANLDVSKETRESASYSLNIMIPLNKEYTDRLGRTYKNFGSYIMDTYYQDPSAFGSSLRLMDEVLPGFYFEHTGGIGSMATVTMCRLNVYYRYKSNDSILVGATSFVGTEEVLQTTKIESDKQQLQALVNDNTCTYLKTPAGIFTELTLPVDEIFRGHENDSINAVKIVLPRINNETNSSYALSVPQTLLMIPKDSLYSFFEGSRILNNRSSFVSTNLLTSDNSYVFNNISQMVNIMNRNRSSENWNKVVLVPVTIETSSNKVSHYMTLGGTRLVGGSQNPYQPIKASVIYSRFK